MPKACKFTGKHLRPVTLLKKSPLLKICEISIRTPFFTDGRLLLSRVKVIPKSTLHCYLGNKKLFIKPEKVSF